MTTAIRAVQQEDGSMRVEYSDGAVRFVPAAPGNRDFEELAQRVSTDSRFRIEGATALCRLRPEDVTARETQRTAELETQQTRTR